MAIATKEQERKALDKIRAIVEGLGPDSYVGTAFEGCFEIAAQNIENDFGCSLKNNLESAEKRVKELETSLKNADSKAYYLYDKVKNLREARDDLEGELEKKEDEIVQLMAEAQSLKKSMQDKDDRIAALENREPEGVDVSKAEELEAENAKLTAEIMKLKAMLFDVMFDRK